MGLRTNIKSMRMSTFPILFLIITMANTANVTIAIIGTNDIHGTALPTIMQRSDTGQRYYYGGLPVMARLIQIIKSEHPGNVLYLDAGDQFQGGIQSSKLISSGKIMNDFYGLSRVDGSAIGNHEFDFGPTFLFPFMSSKDSYNLAANLRSEKGEKDFLPRQTSSQMFSFASGIKIGVIGLITVETPSTTAAFNKGLFPKYKFLQYRQVVLDEATKLRKAGANAVLITSHVGNQCSAGFDYGIWNASSIQPECADDDEMTELLQALPTGTIQGVVQGHRHTVSHVFIKGIPVIGNINGGYYFNVMYLTFNDKHVVVDSKIEGPIPVCQKIFQNTARCHYMDEEQIKNAGPLVKWRFHNQQVYPDPKLNTIYNEEWMPQMKQFLTQIVQNQILLQKSHVKECELANLINDLIHKNFTFADFTVLNMGGFRTTWIPGVILQQHLYNMFPFENVFKSFNISGAELWKTLEIIQSGDAALYQFYGIQTTVERDDDKFKFISARMADGSPIQPDKYYTGVMTDFLLGGGDDFKDVIDIVYKPRDVQTLGEFRSSIRGLLKDMKVIKKGTLIDPDHPRIIIK